MANSIRITYGCTKIHGLEPRQFFVPVHAETGLMNSSAGVKTTGAQTQAAVVEVRSLPARTIELPTDQA